MAARTAAARPYARALWELARERRQTESVARELETLVETLARDRELAEFVGRPWIPAPARQAVALEVVARLGLSDLMRDFVALVARQGRARHLAAIAAAYRELADEAEGRVRARVRTAVPLTEAERDALRQRLALALAGARNGGPVEVVLEEVVDERLLAGFVAEVGSFVVDGSLDGQLARLKERLARG